MAMEELHTIAMGPTREGRSGCVSHAAPVVTDCLMLALVMTQASQLTLLLGWRVSHTPTA